jgi:hypothetical protein
MIVISHIGVYGEPTAPVRRRCAYGVYVMNVHRRDM